MYMKNEKMRLNTCFLRSRSKLSDFFIISRPDENCCASFVTYSCFDFKRIKLNRKKSKEKDKEIF